MVTKSKKTAGLLVTRLDLNSAATSAAFERAAKAYTTEATKTKASAIKALHREGILTKSGRLTKHYSAKT